MKISMLILLGAAMAAACAAPALAHPGPAGYQQTDADQDRDRNTEAYRDGFTAGQADAQRGTRIDHPSDRWVNDDDRRAYREGYDAGFRNGGGVAVRPSEPYAHEGSEAAHFGHEDGLAQGRRDRDKGRKFRPTEGDMYKHAEHGWTADFADKEHYQQLYRQGYVKGYEEGYNGTGPR